MAKFEISEARREESFLRIAMTGASGSGKTFSSLRMAKGLVGDDGSKICLIDSERRSSRLYARDVFSNRFHVLDLPDFKPETYTEAIQFAQQKGYSIIIIDSLSHAWVGEGGLLDQHGKLTEKVKNSYTAWRDITPKHNKLVDTILQADTHIITTLRAKTSYDMVKDEKGRQVPTKIGLAPEFRNGIEYEFTAFLELDQSNEVVDASKDRTRLFHERILNKDYFKITEEEGEKLANWLQEDEGTEDATVATGGGMSTTDYDENLSLLENMQAMVPACETEEALKELFKKYSKQINASDDKQAIFDLFTEAKNEK